MSGLDGEFKLCCGGFLALDERHTKAGVCNTEHPGVSRGDCVPPYPVRTRCLDEPTAQAAVSSRLAQTEPASAFLSLLTSWWKSGMRRPVPIGSFLLCCWASYRIHTTI